MYRVPGYAEPKCCMHTLYRSLSYQQISEITLRGDCYDTLSTSSFLIPCMGVLLVPLAL